MFHPLVYEINTRCWLTSLSEQYHAPITLKDIPEGEFTVWRRFGFTHLWLMGVWTIGPRNLAFSRGILGPQPERGRGPAGFSEDDIVGSPYAISGYEVSEALGGDSGLAEFRKKLNANGIKLILDFIPNHTGLDHPWVKKRPELFVQGAGKTLESFRENTSRGPHWIAHGRDPYFPPWADTAQLDYRNPTTRRLMTEELKSIARRCDGVRCDMAMLLLNEVFARTWAEFPFPPRSVQSNGRRGEETDASAIGVLTSDAVNPGREMGRGLDSAVPVGENEFWFEAISVIKPAQPDFLFLAEAYWGLEQGLIELGFDFAYDKRLLDHLTARNGCEVQRHLLALSSQSANASAHFLENHDEPRIASLLSLEEHRAAALLILGLPGMRLLHEGQLTGAAIRTSVHVRRCPTEASQIEIVALYERLLTTLQRTAVGRGDARLLRPTPAWAGNPTAENLIVAQWQSAPGMFDLVVVNLASHPSQCYVELKIESLAGGEWEVTDLLSPERFKRDGDELLHSGLYLDLPGHGAQLFQFRRFNSP